MKVLVTGANGQLGSDIVRRLEENNIECIGVGRDTLDITNEKQVKEVITYYNPDVVIHCAAYTAVDKAEDDKKNCYNTNVLGTKYVAEVCRNIEAKMVYISTDYVFDGGGNEPFEVTDKPNPINYYGRTKYEGELVVQKFLDKYMILRVSWVFGSNGNNFVKKMLDLGEERDEVSVVADQFGSPTYTFDLAGLIVDMIQTEKYGIYHVTNEGYCSWYEFACEIFNQAGINIKVNPIKSDEFSTKAIRPKNSRMSKEKLKQLGFSTLNEWQKALHEMINYSEKES